MRVSPSTLIAPISLVFACTGRAQDSPSDTDAVPDSDSDAVAASVVCPMVAPTPPACGSGPVDRAALLPGPGASTHDAALAAKALDHDRVFAAFITHGTGLNTEVQVREAAARATLQAFVDGEGWDLAAATGSTPEEVATLWTKVAGAYAGVGLAADAYRYGVLRDEGAACDDVGQARAQLVRGIEGLLRNVEITGTPGVITRGLSPTDPTAYGSLVEVVDLFDDQGNALPPDKTNGTWRADVGGDHPGYVWEDSCSRDMLVGWAAGFGALAEVIGADDSIPSDLRDRVADAARSIGLSLRTVQDSGYDLEIRDADGRMTYHGILHEESVDRVYLAGAMNGMNAVMSLGITAALARASQDPEAATWIADQLLAERDLPGLIAEYVTVIDIGRGNNYSGHNMAFLGGYLVERHLCDPAARAAVGQGMKALYHRPDRDWQPIEQGQALYDLVAAKAALDADGTLDEDAVSRMVSTLSAFPAAPYWDLGTAHCDADEIEAGACLAEDGTTMIPLADGPGRNDALVSSAPIPWSIRPPSNYHWRSNPYQVDRGGDGTTLLSAVDFRFVHWSARWMTR